jgi:3-phosphoshikimate 1-carboxyvinyltransferase
MSRAIEKVERLRGAVRPPGDKSISHRAVMIAALADGRSSVEGLSVGEDVHGTLRIVAQLGATVARDGDAHVIVGPAGGLSSSPEPLDCGNSGTTMRLLCGLIASAAGDHLLTGDVSLSARPMDRVARPLRDMGMAIDGQGDRVLPPLRVRRGTGPLRAIDYVVPEASAQVKSAILLAALAAEGHCVVTELVRTRTNTEEMLSAAGVSVHSVDRDRGRIIEISPRRPAPRDWRVPSDPSQAAFFIVGALICADGDVSLSGLYSGAERVGFLDVLDRMGAALERSEDSAGLSIRARTSQLRGTEVDASEIPSVDEVPILAVAAAAAEGRTRFRDVGELRIKESDRLAGTIELVRKLGGAAKVDRDDLVVVGLGSAARFKPFEFDGGLDHRMVMAAAIAGACGSGVKIESSDAVATSYPNFFDELDSLR